MLNHPIKRLHQFLNLPDMYGTAPFPTSSVLGGSLKKITKGVVLTRLRVA